MDCNKCLLCRCGKLEAYGMSCIIEQKHIDEVEICPLDRLASYKSADVLEVVHARWIEDGDNQPMSCDKCYRCSNCHGNRRFKWQLKPFCEDCVAKMDVNEST